MTTPPKSAQNFWTTPYSEALAQAVQKEFDVLSCHDWDHTLRVLNNARKLIHSEHAESENAIIELAIILHDVARGEEAQKRSAKICHAQRGAERTPEFLRQCGVPEAWFSAIQECIRSHRFRSKSAAPKTLAAKIVFDADKLDALGAFGVARALFYAAQNGARLHNTREEAIHSEEHSINDTAYREYLVKLIKIPKLMLTESGEKLAEERLETTRAFFEALNAEES